MIRMPAGMAKGREGDGGGARSRILHRPRYDELDHGLEDMTGFGVREGLEGGAGAVYQTVSALAGVVDAAGREQEVADPVDLVGVVARQQGAEQGAVFGGGRCEGSGSWGG